MNIRSIGAWFARSIARRLSIAFFSVFLLTYLVTALVVLSAVYAALTDAELDALGQLARLKLGTLDAQVSQMELNLRAWSRLDVMNDLASGDVDKRVASTLESLKHDYGLKGSLYAFDATGQLVASSGGVAGNIKLPAAWHATQGPAFIDKHLDPLAGGRNIVALSIPVHSGFLPGYVLGTLVMTYPWSAIRAALAPTDILLHEGAAPVLLEGPLALGTRGADLRDLAGRQGWTKLVGHAYLVNHAMVEQGPLAGWRLVVTGGADRVQAHLDSVAWQLAGLCLLLAGPLALAIRWMAMRLSAPLRELTRVVTTITGTGEVAPRVQLRSSDELGQLADAFNDMAERLQIAARDREQFVAQLQSFAEDLENKVTERTRELTVKNDALTQALADLRAAQAQLVHQEKMASLGQLVAGVAHEINNPIGFIYANFPHLERDVTTLLALLDHVRSLPMPAPSAQILDTLYADSDVEYLRTDLMKIIRSGKSGASRVKAIVSALRSFSRLDEAVTKYVKLEEGLDDTIAILQHDLKNRIEVVKDYRLNHPVSCFPGQLNQVFMNILHNAIQAIDGPGRVTVETAAEGAWAVVRISDTGSGIPKDILGRIFDPFFTTKKVGEGTGLGLSISYGIVEKHGGRIDVESTPGRGTTFTIRLPRAAPSE